MIEFTDELTDVDWTALTEHLRTDDFDNGRTPDQLRDSFVQSAIVVIARDDVKVVGTARALSDGIGNTYVLDVWTHGGYRRQGIAREMMRRVFAKCDGHHIYLQADGDVVAFYEKLGFRPQPHGLSRIVGNYLRPASVTVLSEG